MGAAPDYRPGLYSIGCHMSLLAAYVQTYCEYRRKYCIEQRCIYGLVGLSSFLRRTSWVYS